MNYRLGHAIQSDILFGTRIRHKYMIQVYDTSQGEITTYCAGKHFVLNENAHASSINCLKVTDKINGSALNILTGGEDGLIKIWDTAVSLI
jgi:WD40 repeat protein